MKKENTGNTEGPGNTGNTRKYLKPKKIFETQGNTKKHLQYKGVLDLSKKGLDESEIQMGCPKYDWIGFKYGWTSL